MKKILPLLLIILVAGCVQYGQTQQSGNIVQITSTGFVPATLTISAGDTVTFVNTDNIPHWPASDIHPTHRLYPELGGCIGSTFDACHDILPGENWSFTFNHKGTWTYHDHKNPALVGTIVVQ